MIDSPSNREKAARGIMEAAGGKLLSFYLTTGETDWMAITEFDDGADLMSFTRRRSGLANVGLQDDFQSTWHFLPPGPGPSSSGATASTGLRITAAQSEPDRRTAERCLRRASGRRARKHSRVEWARCICGRQRVIQKLLAVPKLRVREYVEAGKVGPCAKRRHQRQAGMRVLQSHSHGHP